tara:strand:+ start:49 stop:675 length:627 start_codon:yes stop_codon:yes gene_type:complete
MNNTKYIKKGDVYIISAPSGAGKTSLVKKLCEEWSFIKPSISLTTRKIRDSEVDGKDYFFVSKEDFNSKIQNGDFLEYQYVYGNLYGSTIKSINQIIDQGDDVLLEIDYKGMLAVKKIIENAISIYILPPDIDTLKKRLNQRGEDTEKIINQRMESSIKDLSYSKFADYCVVNDNFDLALYHLQSIILGNKSNSRFLSDWIKSLMIVN